MRRAAAVLLVVTASCLPVPFASPPMRVSGTFGVGSDTPATELADRGVVRPHGIGRFALAPLALVDNLEDRVVDPELGLLVEGILGADEGDTPDTGAYLGVAWHFWQRPGEDPRAGQRLLVRATADLVWQYPGAQPGGGASLALGWEMFGFARSTPVGEVKELPAYAGLAWGEGGVGFELAGAARFIDDQVSWQLGLGLTVRIPATAGFMLVPLYPTAPKE